MIKFIFLTNVPRSGLMCFEQFTNVCRSHHSAASTNKITDYKNHYTFLCTNGIK